MDLCNRFNEVWYEDKDHANRIAKKIVETFSSGKDEDFFHKHYDRIFTNLNFSEVPNVTKIAILCFPHYVDFMPSEVMAGKKFSGSEEALVYMSNQLASDYRVVIYANITHGILESLKPHNPRYLPLSYYHDGKDNEELYDIIICWRMYDFNMAKKRLKSNGRIYLWVQDLPPNSLDTNHLTGVFYLSDYQRELFESRMNRVVPYVIAGNGLVTSYYDDKMIERKKHSCFYGSNYGKGLRVLLEVWGDVVNKFPDATLHICFGRTNWGTITDEELDYIVKLIERYPSIKEYGRLSNKEIVNVMKSCSVFSYPCIHPSATFEITAVQAQACGCIPAVLWKYCIPEVVHSSSYYCEEVNDYLGTLIDALSNEDNIDREVFRQWGRQFTWERVKGRWLSMIEF